MINQFQQPTILVQQPIIQINYFMIQQNSITSSVENPFVKHLPMVQSCSSHQFLAYQNKKVSQVEFHPIYFHDVYSITIKILWQNFQIKISSHLKEDQKYLNSLYRKTLVKQIQQIHCRLQNCQNNRQMQIITEFIQRKNQFKKKIQLQDIQISKLNFKEEYKYYLQMIEQKQLEVSLTELVYNNIMWYLNSKLDQLISEYSKIEKQQNDKGQLKLFQKDFGIHLQINSQNSIFTFEEGKLCDLAIQNITSLTLIGGKFDFCEISSLFCFNNLLSLDIETNSQSLKQVLQKCDLFNISKIEHLKLHIDQPTQNQINDVADLLQQTLSLTKLAITDNGLLVNYLQLNTNLQSRLQSLTIISSQSQMQYFSSPILLNLLCITNLKHLHIQLKSTSSTNFQNFDNFCLFLKKSSLVVLGLIFKKTAISSDNFFHLTHAIRKIKLIELVMDVSQTEVSIHSIHNLIYLENCNKALQTFKLTVSGNVQSKQCKDLEKYWNQKIVLEGISNQLCIMQPNQETR